MRGLALAVASYAEVYGDWPSSTHHLQPFIPEAYAGLTVSQLLDNPRRGRPSFRYDRPPHIPAQVSNPADVAVIFEIRSSGAPDDYGMVAFLDGSTRQFTPKSP